jgi:hypothetical protein
LRKARLATNCRQRNSILLQERCLTHIVASWLFVIPPCADTSDSSA